MRPRRLVLVLAIVMLATGVAHAQDVPKDTPRPTGLPSSMNWEFHFDAGCGIFGYRPAFITNPKEGVKTTFGDRDHWMEGFAKPRIDGAYKLKSTSELYGKLSAVGERTYDSPPELVGPPESSFFPEDASVGWRSGKAFERLGENALDFTVGRTVYTVGHGFLLWDGAAEGGSRGGYWTNARKAWGFATVARFKPGHHTFESFYLKKDDLPEHHTDTTLWGSNYEFRIGETSTFGGTYMKTWADPHLAPRRNGLNVYNVRAYTAPIPAVKDLSFELEFASERNHDAVHAEAWTAQAAYQLSDVTWKPKFTYRYALFEGNDPATRRDESFDPLFLGFSNWGTWWQGEIAGEYFLSNSNLISHLVSASVTPNDAVGGGLMFYRFLLDQPTSFAPGVTDRNIALELDAYTDWKINKNFTASFVLAFADPQEAVQQSSGRTQNFKYGMVFLAYSY